MIQRTILSSALRFQRFTTISQQSINSLSKRWLNLHAPRCDQASRANTYRRRSRLSIVAVLCSRTKEPRLPKHPAKACASHLHQSNCKLPHLLTQSSPAPRCAQTSRAKTCFCQIETKPFGTQRRPALVTIRNSNPTIDQLCIALPTIHNNKPTIDQLTEQKKKLLIDGFCQIQTKPSGPNDILLL